MGDLDRVLRKYATSQELMDRIRYTAETLSMEFECWDEQHVAGPSLYFLVVADIDFAHYTDPLGGNRWPVERCRVVSESTESFTKVARDVAFSCDGAVVVTGDGTIQEQMVRVRSPGRGEIGDAGDLDYPDWMGTKHLSALETSTREGVLWAVTLSEEDGRVTTFLDGSYQDYRDGAKVNADAGAFGHPIPVAIESAQLTTPEDENWLTGTITMNRVRTFPATEDQLSSIWDNIEFPDTALGTVPDA